MKLQKIGLSALLSILATLTIGEFRFIPNSQFKIINSQALAQTQAERKAEAERLLEQGSQYYQSRQFQAGLQSWQQALIIYREIKNRQGEGWTLERLGGAYYYLGNYAKALEYAQQQLAIAREINDSRSEGVALGILKEAYYYLGNYAKALDYAQQQLAIAREINDSRSEVEADRNLRSAYDTIYNLDRYAEEIKSAQQQLAIAREIKDRRRQGIALGILGLAYSDLGDYAKAIEYAQQQLAIAREINDPQGEAVALGNLGLVYRNLGDYAKVIEYAQQLLTIAQEINDRQNEGIALRNLGDAYINLGDHAKALEYAQQGLAIAREIKDRQSEGRALGIVGQVYYSLGNYPKALEYARQQLAIAREINDSRSEVEANRNLRRAYGSIDNHYAKDIESAQQQLAIAREIKNRQSEVEALLTLARLYERTGSSVKVIEYAQQLLVIAREINDHQSEGSALGILGEAYINLGDYAKAIEYEQPYLVIVRENKNRRSEAVAWGILAFAYRNLGDYAKAIEYGQQSLVIAREIKNRRIERAALGNLGDAYRNLGDYAKVFEYAPQLLASTREIKNEEATFSDTMLAFYEGAALSNLGWALYTSGNLTGAEQTLLDSIKVSESFLAGFGDASKVAMFDGQANSYVNLQKVLIAQKKTQEALEIAERGRARAFVQLLASRLAPSAYFPTTINPLNIQQIQQIAKEQNATLVEYSTIGNEALYIWVIKPTGEITFRSVDLKSLNINLPEASEQTRVSAATGTRGLNEQDTALAEMIRGTREALGVSAGDTANRQAANRPASTPANSRIIYPKLQQSYQLLIQPIADLLPTDPNAPVIFIPHQSLFLVPFVALQDPTGQYLIEKHTILTAPAIQILQLTHQSRHKVRQLSLLNNLVVGNPIMPKIGIPPRQLAPLPGSEREAITIAQLLNTKPITGSQATKASITQQMLKSRIIHLATHGLLNEVKRRDLPGAIALAPSGNDDGLLTSSEILNLKLNAELVVLSACNTGRGKITGDGVLGLSRALISAGVPSIIVSLWLVPDEPTAELMAEFYRQLQKNPNKAQALRQAMLMTMKMHPTPQDWAAFTLIGEAE
ncbi:CHAT domain-containing protein [Microcoleus sp. Pol12B4]|uniref:CHAT domain-containing protein n=1 Tax=Microcoleus sp. Pol12B4 TaxID=3055395 RepID=UPI002FD0F48B